jgi:hypothetical protein
MERVAINIDLVKFIFLVRFANSGINSTKSL